MQTSLYHSQLYNNSLEREVLNAVIREGVSLLPASQQFSDIRLSSNRNITPQTNLKEMLCTSIQNMNKHRIVGETRLSYRQANRPRVQAVKPYHTIPPPLPQLQKASHSLLATVQMQILQLCCQIEQFVSFCLNQNNFFVSFNLMDRMNLLIM